MNEKLSNFLTGIGILAESTKVSYDSFIKVGFSNDQAIYLAAEFMKQTLVLGTNQDKPEK